MQPRRRVLHKWQTIMNSETKLVIELWDYFRDMISAGKRHDAVLHILRLFEEYGIDVVRHDLEGEDEYLDEALQSLADDSEDESDDWHDHEES